MYEHFVPDDREDSDNEIHRKIRKRIQEPIDTAEDKAFTEDEIIANLKIFNSKKAHGENGLTSDILTRAFLNFSLFYTNIKLVFKLGKLSLKNENIQLRFLLLNQETRNAMTCRSIDQLVY
jgi:hypothetical protein